MLGRKYFLILLNLWVSWQNGKESPQRPNLKQEHESRNVTKDEAAHRPKGIYRRARIPYSIGLNSAEALDLRKVVS